MPLKILVIDAVPDRARALEEKLSETGFAQIMCIDGGDLANAVEREQPDLVIVDMALPDRDALEDIRAVSASLPVVVFAGIHDSAFAREAVEAGVCSYNLSGVTLEDVRPVMEAAIALFRRYRAVETELATAKALLEERRQIERAKAVLMRDRKMTEPEAYRWLQKRAMNESRRLSDIVAEFVNAEDRKQRGSRP